jgi:hypothetical protein
MANVGRMRAAYAKAVALIEQTHDSALTELQGCLTLVIGRPKFTRGKRAPWDRWLLLGGWEPGKLSVSR